MRALLNSLGLTLWSSIAIVLAVGLVLIGYRVSLNTKDSSLPITRTAAGVVSAPPDVLLSVDPSLDGVTPLMHGQRFSRAIEPEITAAQTALRAGRWQEVIDDAQAAERKQGITVFDTKTINHFKAYAHLQLHEYNSALTDFERVLATGAATPEETTTISKIVSTLQAHVGSQSDQLPEQKSDATPQEAESTQQEPESNEARGGTLDVRLGELYYGFGDYQKAVDAITRGLQKHPGAHLDDAYVYLGLAEQKLDNTAEARRAFARLTNVPNINPRILRLWTLYADTLAGQTQTASSRPPSLEPAASDSTSMPIAAPTHTSVWTEGRNYRRIPRPVPTSLPPGKVEVTELFSYACPACNQLQPYMRRLLKTLPPNAVVSHVPVSFPTDRAWPMFQQAYVTAQELGVVDKTHDAMFDAVWSSREFAITDAQTGALRSPTIEAAAEFYQKRAGVPVATFLRTSRSLAVEAQVRLDEDLIKAYGIDGVPSIVVDGKYLTDTRSAGSAERLIELVTWLVAKDTPPPEQASLQQPPADARD